MRSLFLAGCCALLAALLGSAVSPVRADTLQVGVVDARDHQPIAGAFVMVGSGKGIPFTGNTGLTSPAGTIVFQNAKLVGPQTVTAGAAGYAYTAVIQSAVGSVVLPLYPSTPQSGIYGPKARVTGPVTGINTVSNDGKLDIGMVLPALTIDAALGTGNLNFEVPPDTMSLPLPPWQTELPGNVVVPTQTEYYILQFSKPSYKIDLPAQTSQSLYVLSARLPIDALLNFPSGGDPFQLLKLAEIRQFGIERDRAVGNGATITITADQNLRTQLTVRFTGVPSGTNVAAFSLGSLPRPGGGEEVVGYDTDSALADTLGAFVLASSVPAGDISDVSNLVAGVYQDSSAYAAFMSGRIDRTHFTLPATRVLSDFYVTPTLTRQGARFFWNDVHDPATEPAPTWVLSSITLGPTAPADTTVNTSVLWRIIAPATPGNFALPSLPAEAPGPPAGLVDVNATPDADRLIWDATIANPAGDLTHVLTDPTDGLTHFSERAVTLDLLPADAPGTPLAGAGSHLRLQPNPATGTVGLRLDSPLSRAVRFEVIDAAGRRLAILHLANGRSSAVWDGCDENGRRVPPGMYMIRSADPSMPLVSKVLILR